MNPDSHQEHLEDRPGRRLEATSWEETLQELRSPALEKVTQQSTVRTVDLRGCHGSEGGGSRGGLWAQGMGSGSPGQQGAEKAGPGSLQAGSSSAPGESKHRLPDASTEFHHQTRETGSLPRPNSETILPLHPKEKERNHGSEARAAAPGSQVSCVPFLDFCRSPAGQ